MSLVSQHYISIAALVSFTCIWPPVPYCYVTSLFLPFYVTAPSYTGKELELCILQAQRRAGHYPGKPAALPEGQASTVLSSVPFPLPSTPAISGQALQLPFMQLVFRPSYQLAVPSQAPACILFFSQPAPSINLFLSPIPEPHHLGFFFFLFSF